MTTDTETIAQQRDRLAQENTELRKINELRRVENLELRERIGMPAKPTPKVMTYGLLVIDGARHRVTLRGKPVVMARRMFQLLYFLASHPDELFTHDEILTLVWGSKDYERSNVTEQVRRIRVAIGAGWIVTVLGVGYRFQDCQ